jgi:uncharacterized membrane protein YeaQ/YmgE (transglycosylase-associated protein family)
MAAPAWPLRAAARHSKPSYALSTVASCIDAAHHEGADPFMQEEAAMEGAQVGWIAAIIIGGIAGWLAEMFMKSQMGLLANIVLGIVGAAIASAILSFFGINLGGWVGYLVLGFIGACLLIWIARMLRST